MKRYLFITVLLLITLVAAYPTIQDLQFINLEYDLDSKYLPQLISFSLQHNIRIETLQNWIMAESSGREKAYNKQSGDKGLCQLHNVRYLKNKYWPGGDFSIWRGEHNLFIALAYLSDLITEHGVYYGFMAYNIGSSRIRAGNILDCGIKYVSGILPEVKEKEAIVFIGDNTRLILVFREQWLFDDRRKYV